MNDISNKRETQPEGDSTSKQEGTSHLEASSHQKLQAFLLLLYQSYLLKETGLEPQLQMALWRQIQFSDTFREKVRLAQLAILKEMPSSITNSWETSKKIVFPFEENSTRPFANTSKEKHIATYKETVRQLLLKRD